MLKSFRINNFRSLVNVEFRPVGSNLVIGPNNVGKTSLCSALRFISLTASSDLEQAAQNAVVETWNIANVYVKAPTLQFDMTVTLDDEGQALDFEYSLVVGVSPYFIDLWEKNLVGIHLLKPGKPSSVLIQPDVAKVQKLLEEMPLGELHFREMLS